jgi:tetratricopeptide (TPR) repeat protein
MKRITDIPNITNEMKSLYEKFCETGDFVKILPHVDAFLVKYPYCREALIFKARALMAIGRNNEALRCIKMAKRVDKFGLIGRFDEAEIYLKKRKKDESIETYVEAVKSYATELQNGIDSFTLSCNSGSRERLRELTRQALSDFFLNADGDITPFKKLSSEVGEFKDELEFD